MSEWFFSLDGMRIALRIECKKDDERAKDRAMDTPRLEANVIVGD